MLLSIKSMAKKWIPNKVCVGLSLHFQTCSFVFKTMDLVERTTCVKIHKKQNCFCTSMAKGPFAKAETKTFKKLHTSSVLYPFHLWLALQVWHDTVVKHSHKLGRWKFPNVSECRLKPLSFVLKRLCTKTRVEKEKDGNKATWLRATKASRPQMIKN